MGFLMTKPTSYCLKHKTKGTMHFHPDDKTDDSGIVTISYSDGATHRSLTDGKITNIPHRTGIIRARRIWNAKIKEGWQKHD